MTDIVENLSTDCQCKEFSSTENVFFCTVEIRYQYTLVIKVLNTIAIKILYWSVRTNFFHNVTPQLNIHEYSLHTRGLAHRH
jgi:hypothetical protein